MSSTSANKIRPRMRPTDSGPQRSASSAPARTAESETESDLPPVPVLARLPQISLPSDGTNLSQRLDWLKNLDWRQARWIKLDPNWVAGGVLSLVLFLLLMITLNRGSKQAANTPGEQQAPSWNSAGNAATSPPVASSPAVSSANPSPGVAPIMETGPGGTSAIAQNQSLNSVQSSADTASATPTTAANLAPGQSPLDGIYYPRTPFAAPVASNVQASAPATPAQPAGAVGQGSEIRTAQRDGFAPHRAPAQAPPSQAQFEGIITRP